MRVPNLRRPCGKGRGNGLRRVVALAFLSVIPGGNLLLSRGLAQTLPLGPNSGSDRKLIYAGEIHPEIRDQKNRLLPANVTNPPRSITNPSLTVIDRAIYITNRTDNRKCRSLGTQLRSTFDPRPQLLEAKSRLGRQEQQIVNPKPALQRRQIFRPLIPTLLVHLGPNHGKRPPLIA